MRARGSGGILTRSTIKPGCPEPVAPTKGRVIPPAGLIVKVDGCPHFRRGVLPFLATRH